MQSIRKITPNWEDLPGPRRQDASQQAPVQTRLRTQAGEMDPRRWAQGLVVSLSKTGQVQADDAGVRLVR